MLYYTDEELVQLAKQLIIANNGEFSYFDVGAAITGACMTPNENAVLVLALTVVCHNIPYYVNGQRLVRNTSECLKDTITFYNANKAESEIVFRSNEKNWSDQLTGFTLPKLAFGDASHFVFKSGSGTSKPDLKDISGNTYEVKLNYRGGSRAGLHKADYLIDCLNTTIEIRKISQYNNVDLEHYPLARFNGFLSEKVSFNKLNISQKLISGELITEVEKLLQQEGFCWNF